MSSTDEIESLKQQLEEYKGKEIEWKELREHYNDRIKSLSTSTSIEIQTGSFQKKIWRRGKKKREKTVRRGKNPEKFSIGFMGVIEFFAYPFSSTEKVFVRVGNAIATIDKYDLPRLFNIHNRAKWFIEHGIDISKGTLKSKSGIADEIINAFSAGLEREQKEILEQSKKQKKKKDDELLDYIIGMKPRFREKWLDDEPFLRKKWNRYLERQEKKDV